MTSLTLAAILQLSLLANTPETYADAHQATVKTGCPMVIMVGADWCPACQRMEKTVIPKVRERGLLSRVAFALVNLDRERELGQTLTGGGPIPQLIAYRRAHDGWHRTCLIGGQDIKTVEDFITGQVAETDSAAKSSASKAVADPKKEKAAAPPAVADTKTAAVGNGPIHTVSTK